MPENVLHRFAFDNGERRLWVTLHDEQMESVLRGERRVVEAMPQRQGMRVEYGWWYFNDAGLDLLRVEAGTDAGSAITVWEGRIHDAYVGRLCSVLLL